MRSVLLGILILIGIVSIGILLGWIYNEPLFIIGGIIGGVVLYAANAFYVWYRDDYLTAKKKTFITNLMK